MSVLLGENRAIKVRYGELLWCVRDKAALLRWKIADRCVVIG